MTVRGAFVLFFLWSFATAACSPPTSGPAGDAGGDVSNTQTNEGGTTSGPDGNAPEAGNPPGEDSGQTTPTDAAPPTDAPVTAPTNPTYWRDVAPIVNSRCVGCHTEGGIGPMPLTTYAQAMNFAQLMKMETTARRMPPFPADTTSCRELSNNGTLSAAQIATIAAWADAGAPEGNRADYVAPPANTVARPLPERADLTVQPAESYTSTTTSSDDYHCFVMDPQLTEAKDVVGFRVRPGNNQIVHHVILYEVRAGEVPNLMRLDASEAGPGYTCFGGPRTSTNFRQGTTSGDLIDFDTQWVGAWAPGASYGYLPNGTGIRLRPGNRLVMQVHYNYNMRTRGMSDRSAVELFFSPTPVASQAVWLPFAHAGFRIPAGAAPTDPSATSQLTVNAMFPARLFGSAPHMHTRGHSIRFDRITSSGNECLVNVPRWDFHWQLSYWYQTPMRLGATDRLRLSCTWDNTEANQPIIDGVRQQPRTLTWGEGTNDEMCLNVIYVAL